MSERETTIVPRNSPKQRDIRTQLIRLWRSSRNTRNSACPPKSQSITPFASSVFLRLSLSRDVTSPLRHFTKSPYPKSTYVDFLATCEIENETTSPSFPIRQRRFPPPLEKKMQKRTHLKIARKSIIPHPYQGGGRGVVGPWRPDSGQRPADISASRPAHSIRTRALHTAREAGNLRRRLSTSTVPQVREWR